MNWYGIDVPQLLTGMYREGRILVLWVGGKEVLRAVLRLPVDSYPACRFSSQNMLAASLRWSPGRVSFLRSNGGGSPGPWSSVGHRSGFWSPGQGTLLPKVPELLRRIGSLSLVPTLHARFLNMDLLVVQGLVFVRRPLALLLTLLSFWNTWRPLVLLPLVHHTGPLRFRYRMRLIC